MEKKDIAGFAVELHPAESGRYAAVLIFLHGLWTGPWLWRKFAGYLTHRGWDCYLVDWHGHDVSTQWDRLVPALCRLATGIETPVVAIGHDLGALLALDINPTRAAIALAPLLIGSSAPPHPVFADIRSRWARLLGRRIRPTQRQASHLLGITATAELVPEPASWAASLRVIPAPPSSPQTAPRLVVAGGADPCAPVELIQRLSAAANADSRIYPEADHNLPLGAHWQAIAADVHRWIIQQLGESVLLLRGDEDLRDE